MIKPVNNHLLIDPVLREEYVVTDNQKYQEIGTVIDIADDVPKEINKGDKVYFDSWLAGKFATEEQGKFYWLVNWADIKAVDYEHPTG